ncbi:MAG: hypothetical protein M0R02_15050, partial [Bacteroidales bacterium]|nr:hypothetical protein [Bacteroidales bacterium]
PGIPLFLEATCPEVIWPGSDLSLANQKFPGFVVPGFRRLVDPMRKVYTVFDMFCLFICMAWKVCMKSLRWRNCHDCTAWCRGTVGT